VLVAVQPVKPVANASLILAATLSAVSPVVTDRVFSTAIPLIINVSLILAVAAVVPVVGAPLAVVLVTAPVKLAVTITFADSPVDFEITFLEIIYSYMLSFI